MEPLIVLAATPLATRLIMGGFLVFLGAMFTLMGALNVASQSAQETGSLRTVNWLLGRSNAYQGSRAVTVGVLRIIGGIFAIVCGIIVMIFGPILT